MHPFKTIWSRLTLRLLYLGSRMYLWSHHRWHKQSLPPFKLLFSQPSHHYRNPDNQGVYKHRHNLRPSERRHLH
jgi:hypothetical protein